MAEQLNFDWPTRVALGPDDYFVSEANVQAYAMLKAPESWPEGKLALIGPKSSGKSHLARVFRHFFNASIISAANLEVTEALRSAPALVIEDMETLGSDKEEELFHLHNHLRQRRVPLLMTSVKAPSAWTITLPDLASRMQATSVVSIDDPDDRLLSAILMKLFQDRQIAPKPQLIEYLSTRIERSFAAAAEIVDLLDREALAQGKPLNIMLARTLLDKDVALG
ncbi:DnaA/Hda family protein [Marivivens sp. LCG002]|uniref:DnaA ATPase domain-containing protein n=1 Tax=Marivivens sp. LCG002 TaxID=3051171 RepID=UPI0025520FCA|nr:DnaA/Hda family protein [Marivivens sp. LCG002]WIV49996.1 DnaA/Hda family protein [Marivivens sp. LCG002]